MKGCKVPFEIDDSRKESWDALTAEEYWSLRGGMTVHDLVAPDEMVEGVFKCGNASGSILSFVRGEPCVHWTHKVQLHLHTTYCITTYWRVGSIA
jgi:hypothetical protein